MTESPDWVEYHFQGITDHDDPTKYENQVRQTGRFTASVWAVHIDIPEILVRRTLDTVEYADVERLATGEYRFEDGRLTVYYRATQPSKAAHLGQAIVREAGGRWDYSITPAGNWNDVLMDTRRLLKRGDGLRDGPEPATEDQGQSGE